MDVALRRMRAEDIPQVIDIEHEAFSPGWVGTPFRRDLNSRYCRFLVACLPDDDDARFLPGSPPDSLTNSPNPAMSPAPDASMWGRMLQGLRSALGLSGQRFSDPLAGYVGIWLQGSQAHITEIAVRESLRGQGIGELLLIGTIRVALEQGMDEVTLEARVTNFIAQALYSKYGFNEMGIRKNYYADNREDALIMTTDAIHTGAYRDKFTRLQERFLERYGEIHIEL